MGTETYSLPRSFVTRWAMVCLAAYFAFSMGACSSSETGSSNEIQVGWSLFTAGRYNEAIAKFNEVLAGDPTIFESYTGLGWAHLKRANLSTNTNFAADLANSRTNFVTAIENDNSQEHAFAGLVMYVLTPAQAVPDPTDLSLAIVIADSLLDRNPTYFFRYDSRINSVDIKLQKAWCYWHLGLIPETILAIEDVPDSNLPANPSLEQILAELQRLSGVANS